MGEFFKVANIPTNILTDTRRVQMNYIYIVNNKMVTANSFNELAKKLAEDIKYNSLAWSQVSLPNTASIANAKNKLFSKANNVLEENMQSILDITFEKDIETTSKAKVDALFSLYFKMVDAKLDCHPLWHQAVTHLGAELQI